MDGAFVLQMLQEGFMLLEIPEQWWRKARNGATLINKGNMSSTLKGEENFNSAHKARNFSVSILENLLF